MVTQVGLPRKQVRREQRRRPLSQPVDRSPLPRLYLALITVITVGGLLLRLPSFNDSLAGDEISTFYIVAGHSLGRVMALVYSRQETTPPLYFILAWATKGLLGSAAQSIRLVSLLTGAAAIPLTFLLGLWTVGRRAALVAATLVACSPYMIYFSTEARAYMLVLFCALLSSISLLRALDTNRPLWWVGYAASTCAAVYSHYTVVFFLVAQLTWAFWFQPKARRALVISNVAAGIAFLPWLGGLRADLAAPNSVILIPVNVHEIDGLLENFWIGNPIITIKVLPGLLALVLAVAGLALGALGLLLKWRKRRRPRRQIPPRVVLIIVLAVAPAVLMILYSWLRVDVLGGGNIIASWPAIALAMGALVTAPPRPLRVAAVTLTIGAFAIGGAKMLTNAAQRTNLDAAVTYIHKVGTNGDPIVSVPAFGNPLSELDAALAGTPSFTYTPGNIEDEARPPTGSDPHPVLRLAAPPLAEMFPHLASPNPQPAFFTLGLTPPSEVARQAASLARNGTLFLVTYFPVRPDVLLKDDPSSPISQFFVALPPSFHIVAHATFPSDIISEYVYVLREKR
jgi:mannosyltransferase